MLSINTNTMALNAQDNLENTQSSMATSVQRLSSGLRINSAADDPAGLSISQRMLSQVNGMNQAMSNANDAISLAQTADGALGQVSNALQTMRTLAVESANATNSSSDRSNLNAEYQQLAQQIQQVLGGTQFNGQNILATSTTAVYQIGANNTSFDQISLSTTDLTSDTTITAVTTSTDISSVSSAQAAMTNIDSALATINSAQATYGADENRFQSVVSSLQVAVQNASSARGQIVDADFAAETSNLTRTEILQQAGTAMLSQANQMPQTVLKLLQ
jgi:flagellin